jgi:osmotically-inducible protein OsmY
VTHQFQKTEAYRVIRDIKGVLWVENDILVTPETSEPVVRTKIVAALHRNAELDSKNIHVATTDHEVWLSGHTRSHAAKAQAELAAWSAPGVAAVHNNIVVT